MFENFNLKDLKSQINSNKKTRLIVYSVCGFFILIILFLAYRQFIWGPSNEKSKDAYWIGLNYASKDSTDLAIDELKSVVKKFDGKIGGENAQFVLGRQYMAKGEFKKALEELSGVDVNDTYVKAMALGLQGDCYSEMKDYKKAFDLYMEAAAADENEFTTPMYLFKAGLHAEKNDNVEGANECYTKIKDDFPQFANQKSIEKYIGRVKKEKK